MSISIRQGAVFILPWTIIEGYSEGCTFLDLYEGVKAMKFDLGSWTFPEKLKNAAVSVSVGKNKNELDSAIITNKVSSTIPVFGHFVRYTVCETKPADVSAHFDNDSADDHNNNAKDCQEPGRATRNINDVLVFNARKLCLPEPFSEDAKITNNKRIVYNKILYLLGNAGLGFTPMTIDEGKDFINALTNCIWTIDPFVDTLRDRCFALPVLFENLFGYNVPENHKHKRGELSQSTLLSLACHLDACLEKTWISKVMWAPIRTAAQTLSDSFHKYIEYLKQKAEKMNENRQLMFPVRSLDETKSVTVIRPCYVVKPGAASRYKTLVDCVEKLEMFKPICLDEYTPQNTRERRYFLDNMKQGLPYKCVHLKFSAGNNLGSHNFLWKIPGCVSETDSDIMQKNSDVIQTLSKDLPSYHTRAMRRAFINKASLLCSLKTSDARYIYKSLAGDCSLGENESEKEIDLRVQQAFEMEDPDIITDLRHHNTGQPSRYHIFFDHAKQYLESVVETAVDERRHDRFTHLAQAMSVLDLLQQVKDICPENTPIPSEQWLRLQFAPKNPSALASLQYTGSLKVKFQVQSRQLRKTHVDLHYASAAFRYLKEFAVKFRDFCVLVAMDDKHHCKVGEPGHPVAAVERGKRVVVAADKVFAVSDHDFTKFSIVPSVTMLIDIPESVSEGSFYRGQVYVGVKDLALEPSSPLRHIAELKDILRKEGLTKPILCIYTDGGPDHRLTFLSVQLSIICLFLSGNYDMIVAARTPPLASWKNPPERVMSILNLALQAVGLMRKETSAETEQKLKSASGLQQLRDIAKDPKFHEEMIDSIEPVKVSINCSHVINLHDY